MPHLRGRRCRGRPVPRIPGPSPGRPEKSRLSELDAAVPTLVIQGESDPFMPPDGPRRRVVRLPGNHGLKADLPAVTGAVRDCFPRSSPDRIDTD